MDYSQIASAASVADDQSEVVAFKRELPREGVALLRLRDYIELGNFDSNTKGYKPSNKVILTFELLHPDHLIEINDEKFPATLSVQLDESRGAKSRWRKLFNAMNYSGTKTHFSQMLGDAFLGKLFHNTGKDKKTYVNLNDPDGAWHIGAPVQIDALSNAQTTIPVPELNGESKMFLWENAGITEEMIKFMWDAMYIDGEDQNGKSKNWIQNRIMTNNQWEGSATQAAIQGASVDLSGLTGSEPAEPVVVTTPATPVADVPAVDPLASLGL